MLCMYNRSFERATRKSCVMQYWGITLLSKHVGKLNVRIKIKKVTTPHNEPLGRLWYHRSQTGSRSNFSSHQVDIVFVFSDTHKA